MALSIVAKQHYYCVLPISLHYRRFFSALYHRFYEIIRHARAISIIIFLPNYDCHRGGIKNLITSPFVRHISWSGMRVARAPSVVSLFLDYILPAQCTTMAAVSLRETSAFRKCRPRRGCNFRGSSCADASGRISHFK